MEVEKLAEKGPKKDRMLYSMEEGDFRKSHRFGKDYLHQKDTKEPDSLPQPKANFG